MPLYEYRCERCSKQFEATQSVHARVEDTECPFCHAQEATRLLSSFSSKVVGDHKPGFTELKANAMNHERMEKFSKLPPLNAKRNVPPPNTSSASEPVPGSGAPSGS
ncbi:MAG: zinc ribbon domain-containing protein [Nitrospiraceae bacterium]|jgi:putative FmdB family regulatory protein|nr:zinc ribbon domain-containing protein [Nitrospiraceae bacterium]